MLFARECVKVCNLYPEKSKNDFLSNLKRVMQCFKSVYVPLNSSSPNSEVDPTQGLVKVYSARCMCT